MEEKCIVTNEQVGYKTDETEISNMGKKIIATRFFEKSGSVAAKEMLNRIYGEATCLLAGYLFATTDLSPLPEDEASFICRCVWKKDEVEMKKTKSMRYRVNKLTALLKCLFIYSEEFNIDITKFDRFGEIETAIDPLLLGLTDLCLPQASTSHDMSTYNAMFEIGFNMGIRTTANMEGQAEKLSRVLTGRNN